MKRPWYAVLLLVLFGGCRPAPQAPEQPQPEQARRIVSMAPSVTEILFAVGAGSKVVGVDDYSNFPDAATRLPRIGGIQPNYEAIVALKPDLVIGVSDLQGPALARLKRMNVPVMSIDTAGYDRTIDAIVRVANRVGDPALGREVSERLEQARDRAKDRNPAKPVRVLFVAEAAPTLYVGGKGTFVDEMIQLAGGTNAADIKDFGVLSREALAKSGIDVVIVTSDEDAKVVKSRLIDPDTRVLVAPRDIIVRPGPRLAEGLKWLSDAFQPGRKP